VQVNSPNTSNNTNSYNYDSLGNLSGLTDENLHTTQNAFDLLLEPISKTLPDGMLTETRSYDAAGNVASMTSSNTNGASVSYTYDDVGRLSTVVDNRRGSGANTTTYTYDPASNLATATYPNGLGNRSICRCRKWKRSDSECRLKLSVRSMSPAPRASDKDPAKSFRAG
jgi:YD repeat-containing protein